MRSPVSRIAGVHIQDLTSIDMIRDLGLRTYTILHPQAGLWRGIKAAVPDAVALLRMYEEGSDHATDWLDLDPKQEAGKAAAYVRDNGFGPDCIVTFGNEGNLPGETAGVQATYQQINDWYSSLADEWNGPLGNPCRLGSMGFSPGNGEDQVDRPGGIGFQTCQPAFNKCAVIIVHEYWPGMEGGRIDAGLIDESGHWDNHFYAFRDAVTCRKWYPDKPVWIGEWNSGGFVDEPTLHQPYANCCDFFLRHTAEVAPWVEGATHFILDSFTQPYQIARVPVILDRFRAIGHETVDAPPAPAPAGVPVHGAEPVYLGANGPSSKAALQTIYHFDVQPASADPAWHLTSLREDTSHVAEFPIFVLDAAGLPLAGVPVSVYTDTDHWPLTTDAAGKAAVGLNHDSQLRDNSAGGPFSITIGTGGDILTHEGWRGNHDKMVGTFQFGTRAALPPPPPPPPPVPPLTVHTPAWKRAAIAWVLGKAVNNALTGKPFASDQERLDRARSLLDLG